MEETRVRYGAYLVPVLCLVAGILIGFLLSTMKKGKITLFSNNTIGSKNGCRNSASADDLMLGSQKSGASR